MKILVQSFWLAKNGNAPDEYEDSFDFSYNGKRWTKADDAPTFFAVEREMKRPRFAVADGATESSFSGLWARLLVRSYVSQDPRTPKTLRTIVESCGKQWTKELAGRSLSWFAKEKVRQGSFAALVGLSLRTTGKQNRQNGRWTALAAGDSCLFQIRGGQLIAAFPVEHAEGFGYHPLLLSTSPEKNGSVWELSGRLRRTGEWESGDLFLLMTDALGQWFLRNAECGERPWEMLRQLAQPPQLSLPVPFDKTSSSVETHTSGGSYARLLGEKFERWIDEKRTMGAMQNDDVTLLLISVGG